MAFLLDFVLSLDNKDLNKFKDCWAQPARTWIHANPRDAEEPTIKQRVN